MDLLAYASEMQNTTVGDKGHALEGGSLRCRFSGRPLFVFLIVAAGRTNRKIGPARSRSVEASGFSDAISRRGFAVRRNLRRGRDSARPRKGKAANAKEIRRRKADSSRRERAAKLELESRFHEDFSSLHLSNQVLLSLAKICPSKTEEIMGDQPPRERRRSVSLCVGCGSQIHDQYILRVAPDLEWHAACLKCAHCHQFLDETCTCFVRDGKTYCKRDYVRRLARAFTLSLSHVFTYLTKRHQGLFCKADHEVTENKVSSENNNNNPNLANNNTNHSPASNNSFSGDDSGTVREHRKEGKGKGDTKTTRVRTVLNEKQLHTLRTCYAANPRPDALMKEQLVEMTGLSPRVIRVWFQNKRCKDKKRSLAMKQLQQQEKDGRRLGLGGLQGVAMIASSPVRHESPIGIQPVEVQSYQPPWKALTEFAMQADLDRLDPSAPPFQHLVSQRHFLKTNAEPSAPCCRQPSIPPNIRFVRPGRFLMHGYVGGGEMGDLGPPPLQELNSGGYEGTLAPGPPSDPSSHFPNTPSELSSCNSD
ncbi:unnamed protein product [Darwinula stevensoni]|uniref:Uncharacterized protein n=1 Tax=Darwinula stevensoni TaxID=69355 RepID=A0A7R9AB56_9CRUS|nr:unnamed protein product [Darwinula stevensoni]CAG0899081.1 unnamed protein product [Darwinula stevensoni]